MFKKVLAVAMIVVMSCAVLCGCMGMQPGGYTENVNIGGNNGDGMSAGNNNNNVVSSEAITGGDPGALMSNKSFTVDHVSLTLPDGFEIQNQGNIQIAMHPNYNDSINITYTGADNFSMYSKSYLENAFSSALAGFNGIDSYRETKIDGYDTIIVSYVLTNGNIDIKTTQYMIFGPDFTDVVTFGDASGEFTDEFYASGRSITVR